MNKKDFNKPRKRSELPFELQAIGRHIVYSEGTKTEPYYINNIKKLIANRYQVKPNDITIIQGNDKSTNTIYLVNNAIKDVDKRLKNKELIDHVWIFFDKDDFPKSHYDNANKKINNLNNS